MSTRYLKSGCALFIACLLAACSTPAPVRDLASSGAVTVGQAEASLRNYLADTQAQLNARNQLLLADAQSLEAERTRRELDRVTEQQAGIQRPSEVADLMRGLASKSAEARQQQAARMEKVVAANALDPATLATVPAEKLASAKKSFAVLSEELSPGEWFALLSGYAKVISTDVEQLKADRKAAEGNQGK